MTTKDLAALPPENMVSNTYPRFEAEFKRRAAAAEEASKVCTARPQRATSKLKA